MKLTAGLVALLIAIVTAEPIPRAVKAPRVDLGYAVYEGSFDVNSSINAFKGFVYADLKDSVLQTNHLSSIRYAAPPIGKLRFAAPQAPARNRTSVIAATSNPPICPQTGASSETPAAYGFTSALGNEDCLFLNVYAPADAKDLPVFFWIRTFFPISLFDVN